MITSLAEGRLGWFAGRMPADLFVELLEVIEDREEITVVGRIAEVDLPADTSPAEREAAADGRIADFRERTRGQRMEVAADAERRFQKKVSWCVVCGDARVVFTNLSAPVMTRLRQPERVVLDTLVAGGVARSRSDALVWCVRLLQKNADNWLTDLNASLDEVKRVRAQGPDASA